MPRISTINEKSDAPVVTYVHEKQSNTRIQLDATDDIRDARGRILEKGTTLRADFKNGLFSTNMPNYIDKIEDSIAYKNHHIERQEILQARAEEKMVEAMMDAVKNNPELAKKLRSRLTSQQIAAKKEPKEGSFVPKEGKSLKVSVERDLTPAEDEAVDLYPEE